MTSVLNDTTVTATLSLQDEGGCIDVNRIETPNGVRAELAPEDGDDRLRLDALAFESLTWQPGSFFQALVGDDTPTEVADRAVDAGRTHEGAFDRHVDPRDRSDEDVQIGNEFTTVSLRVTADDGRERLEVSSPKMGYGTWIAPAELRGLARLHPSLFSDLLRTPLGPEDHDH